MINTKEIDKITKQLKALLLSKNKDYGDDNIIDLGQLGISYRINDKTTRLLHLLQTKKAPDNETLEDTYLDLAGYAIIGIMLERKKFQK